MKHIYLVLIFSCISFIGFSQNFELRGVLNLVNNTLTIEARNVSTVPNLPISGEEISTISFHMNDGDRILSVNSTNYVMLVPNATTSIITMNSASLPSPESWPIDIWIDLVIYNVVAGSTINDFTITPDTDGDNSDPNDPTISVLNADGFNQSATPQLTILPIFLKSFNATKHTASSAKLDWTTSKEVNSDYFGIERSKDGTTWDEIGRVKAAGDSNVDLAYDYIDDQLPLSRTNGQLFYYRLRMTDLDGAYKYSDIRGVNFDKQALGPITIYPNPTTEIVNIDLSQVVMENGDVYVSVYDMSGRLVLTKQIIGSGIELIRVDQLPSDAYNFIVRQGEQIHQQRVIKID